MPLLKSAHKELRKSKRHQKANRSKKITLQKTIKEYQKNPTPELLSQVYKKLDKAAKTNLIKVKAAARLKSRLAKTKNRS